MFNKMDNSQVKISVLSYYLILPPFGRLINVDLLKMSDLSVRSKIIHIKCFVCIHMRLWLQLSSVLPRQLAVATASRWIQMETPHAPSTTWSRSSPNLTRPDRPTTTVVSDTHHFLFCSDSSRLGSQLQERDFLSR